MIFAADEQTLLSVDPSWSPEELLAQEGTFFLKDLVALLNIRPYHKKMIAKMHREDPEQALAFGVRKVWNHYIVRMSLFASYYRDHIPAYRRADPAWDGNMLLAQKGIFPLSVINGRLPFSPNQIRYQIRRHPNPREAMGAWCDGDTYVIDMAVFSVWVKDLIRQKNENPLGSANFRPKEASS